MIFTTLLEKNKKQHVAEQEIVKAVTPKIEPHNKKEIVIIDDVSGVWDYKLAKCCCPLHGDPIFAFVTINDGVKIHRENCPNALQLVGKFGYRILDARWMTAS